jgi:hypothetical protein
LQLPNGQEHLQDWLQMHRTSALWNLILQPFKHPSKSCVALFSCWKGVLWWFPWWLCDGSVMKHDVSISWKYCLAWFIILFTTFHDISWHFMTFHDCHQLWESPPWWFRWFHDDSMSGLARSVASI